MDSKESQRGFTYMVIFLIVALLLATIVPAVYFTIKTAKSLNNIISVDRLSPKINSPEPSPEKNSQERAVEQTLTQAQHRLVEVDTRFGSILGRNTLKQVQGDFTVNPNLTASGRFTQSALVVSNMLKFQNEVTTLQQTAVIAKDIIPLLCINENLAQIKALAEAGNSSLDGLKSTSSNETGQQLYVLIVASGERVLDLTDRAKHCSDQKNINPIPTGNQSATHTDESLIPPTLFKIDINETEKSDLGRIYTDLNTTLNLLQTQISTITNPSLLSLFYQRIATLKLRATESILLIKSAAAISGDSQVLESFANVENTALKQTFTISSVAGAETGLSIKQALYQELKIKVDADTQNCPFAVFADSHCETTQDPKSAPAVFYHGQKLETVTALSLKSLTDTASSGEFNAYLVTKLSFTQTDSTQNLIHELSLTKSNSTLPEFEYLDDLARQETTNQQNLISQITSENNPRQIYTQQLFLPITQSNFASTLISFSAKDPQTALKVNTNLLTESINRSQAALSTDTPQQIEAHANALKSLLETKELAVETVISSKNLSAEQTAALTQTVQDEFTQLSNLALSSGTRTRNPNQQATNKMYKLVKNSLNHDVKILKDTPSQISKSPVLYTALSITAADHPLSQAEIQSIIAGFAQVQSTLPVPSRPPTIPNSPIPTYVPIYPLGSDIYSTPLPTSYNYPLATAYSSQATYNPSPSPAITFYKSPSPSPYTTIYYKSPSPVLYPTSSPIYQSPFLYPSPSTQTTNSTSQYPLSSPMSSPQVYGASIDVQLWSWLLKLLNN